MSLYRRTTNGVWWIDVSLPTGERIRKSTGTKEKAKAKEYESKLIAEAFRVVKLGEKPRRTWKEAASRWLREMENKRSINKDEFNIIWLDSHFGGLYLDEITRDRIDVVKEERQKQGASNSTTNRTLALIRSILRRARDEWEWINQAPAIRLLPEKTSKDTWLTREEARTLLLNLPEHLRDMAEFALATGLRSSNITGLEWKQVNLERRLLVVPSSQSKSGKPITVPLINEAVIVLKKQLGKNSRWVFVYKGKPVERVTTKAWYKACERAGLKGLRFHDLRHTWASWHVQAGTPLHDLQSLGAWSDVRMVQRYAHLSADRLHESASNISGLGVINGTFTAHAM